MSIAELPKTDVVTVDIRSSDITVDISAIERYMGYPEGETPEYILQSVQDILEQSRDFLDVHGGYTVRNVERVADKSKLLIGGQLFSTNRIIAAQMVRSQYAALFLCTIGPGLENWARQLSEEGKVLDSYIVDHIASESAEKAVDLINEKVKADMGESGLGVTLPYSPGYCGWPLSDQPALFSFFPDSTFGISLTDTHLMRPIKSVSGIIGIGQEVRQKDYPCKTCKFQDCYKNRSK